MGELTPKLKRSYRISAIAFACLILIVSGILEFHFEHRLFSRSGSILVLIGLIYEMKAMKHFSKTVIQHQARTYHLVSTLHSHSMEHAYNLALAATGGKPKPAKIDSLISEEEIERNRNSMLRFIYGSSVGVILVIIGTIVWGYGDLLWDWYFQT